MGEEIFIESVKLFNELYKNKDIIVVWRRNKIELKVKTDLNKKLKEMNTELSEEKFIENTFEIIHICKLNALGININNEEEIDPFKYDIIKQHLLNKDFLDELNIQLTSTANLIDETDFEILTKRSKENTSNIITHTVLLNLFARNTFTEEGNSLKLVNIELSKKQLNELVEKLKNVIEDLEKLD